MVIGHHAHILQGVERYKGRYIFYSLGNFSYGGRAIPRDVETMIAQQTFIFKNGELIIDDNVTILPCWMSTRTDINDFCPVIQGGTTGNEIIEKVNGLSYSSEMSFNQHGHPSVSPAIDTDRQVCDASPYEQKPARVPSIIYTLLGE